MKIGFIGSRMAANLQKRGHPLLVHNRTSLKGTGCRNGDQRMKTSRYTHALVSWLIVLIVGIPCGLLLLPAAAVDYVRPGPITAEGRAPGLKAQLLSNQNERKTWVLAFHKGDEVMAGVTEFARKHHISAAHLTAIGAFSNATLAWYDVKRKAFRTIPVPSEVEVVSLIGNITVNQDNSPLVHIHCALGNPDGKLVGGHLLEAHVSVTLELFLTAEPTSVHKVMDDEMGLMLIE